MDDKIEELSCMVITFITPFGICVKEKCVVVKVEDTMPSCMTNLVSVRWPPTWEDFSDVHSIF